MEHRLVVGSSSQPQLLSHALSRHGQYPSQLVFTSSRGSTPSAHGYLPQNTPVEYGRSNPHSRPTSRQRSNLSSSAEINDRPPSIPLRMQTTPKFLPDPEDNPPNQSIHHLGSHSASQFRPQPHPNAYQRQVFAKRDRVWTKRTGLDSSKTLTGQYSQRNSQFQDLTTQLANKTAQGPRANAKDNKKTSARPQISSPGPHGPSPRKKAPRLHLQQDDSTSIAASTQHGGEQVKGLKRLADEPSAPVPAKRGEIAAFSKSTLQSITSSQKQALVVPIEDECFQDYGQSSSKSAGGESREVLRQLSSNITSQKYGQDSLPTEEVIQKSSKVGQYQATTNSISSSFDQIDLILYPNTQGAAESDPHKGHSGDSHGTALSTPEPEPLTPHHRPWPREELIEDIVSQSQEINARQEKSANQIHDTMAEQQQCIDASTQYDDSIKSLDLSQLEPRTPNRPEQHQLKSDEETIARVTHNAWKMMEPLLESPSFDKAMTILNEVDEMAKGELHPAEAASINWEDIFLLQMAVEGGVLTYEELEKVLHS